MTKWEMRKWGNINSLQISKGGICTAEKGRNFLSDTETQEGINGRGLVFCVCFVG